MFPHTLCEIRFKADMVAEEAGLNLEVEGDTGLVVIHFEPLVHTPHTKKTRVIGGRGRGV